MKTRGTTALEYFRAGNLWRDHIALLALPILLWAAEKGRPITYKQLAEELHRRHGEPIKPRKTLYGQPAGKIGYALSQLGEEWSADIPPLNAIVVRGDRKGLPGSGANFFMERYLTTAAKEKMTPSNRDALAEQVIEAVFDYPDWKKVGDHFKVGSLECVPCLESAEDQPIQLPAAKAAMGGPESQAHLDLKAWVADHPECFAVYGSFAKGTLECPLLSGDEVDVSFRSDIAWLGVEVKALGAADTEVMRGVFQCVKYRATMRAMQMAHGTHPNAQALLVVERNPSCDVARLARRLRVAYMNLGGRRSVS